MAKYGKVLCGRQTLGAQTLCRVQLASGPSIGIHTRKFALSLFAPDTIVSQTDIVVQNRKDKNTFTVVDEFITGQPGNNILMPSMHYYDMPFVSQARTMMYVNLGKEFVSACNAEPM